jgi:hypothetical protein
MSGFVHEARVVIFHDRLWVDCSEDCPWSVMFEDPSVPLTKIELAFSSHLKRVAFDEATG